MKLFDLLEADDQETADAEPAAATYVLKDTAEVSQAAYPLLLKRIEKMNKRATKNKLPPITVEIVKEYMKEVTKAQDPQHILPPAKIEIPYYTIKITGDAPQVAGYKFMATIEHQEGGNIIRTAPGEEGNKKIKDFFEAKPYYCDHCKKRRRRIDTFIVREEKTGNLRQVGRNCLADFLGGTDPKAILAYFADRDSIARLVAEAEARAGRGGGGGQRYEHFFPLEDVLGMGAALIRNFGYHSSKKAKEEYERTGAYSPTTAGDLRWVLFHWKPNLSERDKKLVNAARNVTPDDKKQVQDVLTWFKGLPQQEKQSSEFMHNLDVIVNSNKVNARNIGFAVALFPAYARAMNLLKPKQQVQASQHVGSVGQKIQPTKVKVLRTSLHTSDYGTVQIVGMRDDKGNDYTWFNNSQNRLEKDKEYTITGTVKKHDQFNGRDQTVLTRVKAT